MPADTRQILRKKLQSLASQCAAGGPSGFREGHLELLNTLGYKSDKTMPIPKADPARFIEMAEAGSGATIDKAKAKYVDWEKADILFQLTDEELSGQTSLFDATELKPKLLQSYLFFAIKLKGARYSRTDLSNITRQINRLFPMPVMVFYTYNGELSIAVINRRRNKREEHKDVLGKVTLIHGINLSEPHRGHLDIIDSFSVESLRETQTIDSFDALHTAWEEIFNVELLNKRFYRELSDWYFWALDQVEFPDDVEKNRETRNATSLIRLLTRLIFCWFLKEKGLIPDNLFQPERLESVLKSLKPSESTFYQAILQNLFFATLNQRMDKDSKGEPYRRFITNKTFQGKNEEHGVKNLYRYEEHFSEPENAVGLFEDIPFLNGGLFECLDREDDDKKVQYLDGFSQRPKKRPTVPNELFFGNARVVDLSKVYDDKKRRNQKVRGLIHILSGYKFTIVENTPIEQEIALDPELLGQVFENLLASYNPETQTTARKQTGSFYTPRPIVDYMVTESLKCYLKGELCKQLPSVSESDADEGLDILFSYTEKEHTFTDQERKILIQAIDNCKILDPACGSGAFPMGALHKLVFILQKLDPHNEEWEQLRIDEAQEIEDRDERRRRIEQIANDFRDNDDDYGRKLYLIESCLYGIDIQPIAIQITKLRCFISLVCDQRANRNKAKNHGIRPLPNLETKFVAANTLLRLPKQMDLQFSPTVEKLEKELEEVRHLHFAATTRREKLSLQKKDKNYREKLASELRQATFSDDTSSRKLVAWNPYDATSVADFFDSEWMFGKSVKDGFDIVIGNPPYQSAIDHKKTWGEELRNQIKSLYVSASGTWDLFIPFFEVGLNLCVNGGRLAYITPNKYLSSSYGKSLRTWLAKTSKILSLTDVSHLPVFESASVYPVISILEKSRPHEVYQLRLNLPTTRQSPFLSEFYEISIQPSSVLTFLPDNIWGFLLTPNIPILERILDNSVSLGDSSRVCATTTAAEADLLGQSLVQAPAQGWKVLNTGTIDPFSNSWKVSPIRHQGNSIQRPMLPFSAPVTKNRRDLYSHPKIIVAKMALQFEGFIDNAGEYAALNCNCISEPKNGWTLCALAVVLHSDTVAFAYQQYFDGLRMSGGYLPYQAPQLKCIPVPKLNRSQISKLDTIGKLSLLARKDGSIASSSFIQDIGDAVVMECYFHDHMAERDLLFLDELAPSFDGYNSDANESQQRAFLEQFVATHNAPKAKVRNKLLRLTADSPDLLAVIKNEGRS